MSQLLPKVQLIRLQKTEAPTQPSEPMDLRRLKVDEFLSARSLAANTARAYRRGILQFLDWTDTPLAAVTPRQVAQFKEFLMRVDETGDRALSDATVAQTLSAIKSFWGWLVRSGYVDGDPTTAVDLPQLKEPPAQALKPAEVERLIQAVGKSKLAVRDRAIVALLLHGLRANELCGLNVGDVDDEMLYVREAKRDSTGFVPLEANAIVLVTEYLTWRQDRGEVLEPKSPLFVSHSRRNAGERLGYDGLRKMMDGLEAKASIPGLHAHLLRHTCGTELAKGGMNPYFIKLMLRQRSDQSLRRYTKAAEKDALKQEFDRVKRKKEARSE